MDINLILRIVSAALLGGIIGLEREYRAKEAEQNRKSQRKERDAR